MRWNYAYNYFNEYTGRVVYAQNLDDPTLDRSYDYDHVGRPTHFTSGSNARHHTGQGGTVLNDGPYSHGYTFDVWGNRTYFEGWGGIGRVETATYTNNKRDGFTYDPSGNVTNDLGHAFTYDATGQQASASYSGYSLQQTYDGDRLRVKKVENGNTTYYLRSTVLGGQIVAELNSAGAMTRGFVYQGSRLLAVQQNNQVSWVHEDPVAKSKRVTNSAGNVVSTIELDPWGGDTNRSSNEAFQPRRFTTYHRDGNASDDAMHRRYNRWQMRFDQPDPYGGSYDMTNPQSFNRYSYVMNDPVNFVDPLGLDGVLGSLLGAAAQPLPELDPETVTIFSGSNDFEIETGPVETGPWGTLGGGVGGPNLGPDPQPEDTRTSCQKFAGAVEEISTNNPHIIAADFVRRLYSRFANLRNEFSSDGFKSEFQDNKGSPDQARHYVGGLNAGFSGTQWGSETVGRWTANAREYDFVVTMDTVIPLVYPVQNESQKADHRLNAVSTRHGGALSRGEIKPFQLADLIRREVCQ